MLLKWQNKFQYNNKWPLFCSGKPGRPGVPEIKADLISKAELKWTPPTDNGGAPIINYVLEYRAEGQFKWIRASHDTIPDPTYTVRKLKEGIMYEFRVAAENKAGMGPFADNSMLDKDKDKKG